MNQKENYRSMLENNPALEHLVQSLDLCFSDGTEIPNKDITNDYKFSLFWNKGDNTKTTTPRKDISFKELIDIITNPKLKDISKKERPYITPYGTFSKRNNDSLIRFNDNLICLDYDKLRPYEINFISELYCNNPSTLLCLISPSGNGLKVLIRAKHEFKPKDLYNALKYNSDTFTIDGIKPDVMQFVLSQPMFIPYCEKPYYNENATIIDLGLKSAPAPSGLKPIIKFIPSESISNNQQDRINTYFINRVNYLFESIEYRPRNSGTHRYIYSVCMRTYPYLHQQTAITENELTQRLESIILKRYQNDQSRLHSLHRSISNAKLHKLSLIDKINETARVKIK